MKEINIISFDVPYPPNYGGIIDVFFKIQYFHSMGIKVHLHCFEYGKGRQKELDKYCESVNYYKRKTGWFSNLSTLPYIVKSRISDELKNNLLKNDFPILFEGLHTTYLLNDNDFTERIKIFREHNIEHDYYKQLASVEKNLIKKIYYSIEAKRLKHYEKIISKADLSLVVSLTDLQYLKNKYPQNKFVFIPSFHGSDTISINPGKGDFVLYHGNLSVPENYDAAKFIIENIFSTMDIPLVIAGLNPSKKLIESASKYKNITILPNPDDVTLNKLITDAQINLLYTNQPTGLKLKLLNVLYKGRHCIVNSKMVQGTTLGDICTVRNGINQIKDAVLELFKTEISSLEIEKRKQVLKRDYSDAKSFETIEKAYKKMYDEVSA